MKEKAKQRLKTKNDYYDIYDFETVPAPYLPPLPKSRQGNTYSLILDLDETLVHYEEKGNKCKFLIRPYTYKFLENMSKYYEIIIFTAAMQDVQFYLFLR